MSPLLRMLTNLWNSVDPEHLYITIIPRGTNPKPNRTLARLRYTRMRMRRQRLLLIDGYELPNGSTGADCQKIWSRYGWTPYRKGAV